MHDHTNAIDAAKVSTVPTCSIDIRQHMIVLLRNGQQSREEIELLPHVLPV
jgi:hypothetical protein